MTSGPGLPFVLSLLLLCTVIGASAAEYYVTPDGNDTQDGRSREAAFATIQRGVDVLQPGDTLTLGPGEYFESVFRTNLGSSEVQTVIRSEIPGAAVLRGDVPIPPLKKVDGYRFVYAAPFDRTPQGILEHTALRVMHPKALASELEFAPGFYHYSTNSGLLYISNPDLSPPDRHRYTAGVRTGHGLQLVNPRRVTIEGLAATGFPAGWGFLLVTPDTCIVRDCIAFLNQGGIQLSPADGIGGNGGPGNVVEGCIAYGNSFGGIVRYGANHDIIRNCRLYKNVRENSEHFGIMHYGGMHGPLIIRDNLSWGHNFNLSVKPHSPHVSVQRNVALGYIRNGNLAHNLVAGGNEYDRSNTGSSADNILFLREQNLDRDFEFADPLNLDFRLQPDSRFRGTAPDGSDRGPTPYQADVFYLAPAGEDAADGLSMRSPWRTLERAFKVLKPGDTLYLSEGEYAAAPWNRAGDGQAPIHVRGRARGVVTIRGKLTVTGAAKINLERLNFADGVTLADSREVTFKNCTFFGTAEGLTASGARDLSVSHCVFAEVPVVLTKTARVTLRGNVFDNAGGPAVRMDDSAAIHYSDYNAYRNAARCWEVNRANQSLANLQPRHERYAHALALELKPEHGVPRLADAQAAKGLGPHSTAIGLHHEYVVTPDSLDVAGPFLHSAHDTTANLEWWASHPATYTLAWGETPDATNVIGNVGGPDRFNTFSLTGLQPGRTYHFAIRSVTATGRDAAEPLPALKPENARVTFTTAAAPAPPRTYHVAPAGDDLNDGLRRAAAFRTVSRAAQLVGPGDTVVIAGGNYLETVRIRAAGTPERPIVFRAAPGEKPFFGAKDLGLVFQVVSKPDIRFDGLYFDGGFWDKVMIVRQSPRVQVTRCLNVMIGADECPALLVRNCIVRGGWSGLGLGRSPGTLVENNVFIMTILRHIEGDALVARNNIFCECIRGKAHQTLLSLGERAVESNNCFYVRWPEDEKLAINWRPLTEYRVRAGTDALYANPMMPGVPGWSQGWQKTQVRDFADCFATNPELVRRGIGLQPASFDGYAFMTNWVFDVQWAATVSAATNAAAALERAGRDAEALEAWVRIAEEHPLSERLKAEVLEQATLCARRLEDHDRAMELAKRIPIPPIAMRHQMEMMLERGEQAALLAAFNQRALGGRSFHLSYTYPELEDLMADLYYLRSQAYIATNDLAAAEADRRVMNDKRTQLGYRSGEAIHDLVWLRLGDFYRDRLKDDDKAYAAYTNILDRTTWVPWSGRPRKPAARGADATLVEATRAVSEILRKKGRAAEIPQLQFNLLLAQAEAAAAMLQTDTLLARFKEMLAMPGRFTADMQAVAARISALADEPRGRVLQALGPMVAGLQDDTRDLLLRTAAQAGGADGGTALRALLMFAPLDRASELLDQTEKEEREKTVRIGLEPIVKRLRELSQARQWQALVDEFKDAKLAAWEEKALAAEALTLRGQAYAALKDGAQAETDFRKALDIAPGDQTGLFSLAENYRENLADPQRALDAYLRLHQATGVHYGWLSIDVALKAAALLAQQGRRDEALALLRKYDPDKAAGSWRENLTRAVTELAQ